jgi:adenylosuccinate lyase
MAAVRAGVGREAAHEAIKEHAVAVALAMRSGAAANDLYDRLAADSRLGLSREQLDAVVVDPLELTGSARDQVDAIAARVAELAEQYPAGAAYTPGSVL